jgi:hypothetical protein
MKLKISIEVGEYNGTMGIIVSNNGRELYSTKENTLSQGMHDIDVDVDSGIVDINCFGKNSNDTLVKDNTVIKDKYIEIKNISIDLFELKKFYLWHSDKFFETYFSKNETKTFNLPSQEQLLDWYLQILEDHNTQ